MLADPGIYLAYIWLPLVEIAYLYISLEKKVCLTMA